MALILILLNSDFGYIADLRTSGWIHVIVRPKWFSQYISITVSPVSSPSQIISYSNSHLIINISTIYRESRKSFVILLFNSLFSVEPLEKAGFM